MAKKQTPKIIPSEEKEIPASSFVNILQNRRWHIIIIAMSAFLLYANTLSNQFALDDGMLIWKNAFTVRGMSGVKDILSHDSFYGFFKQDQNYVSGGRYRPLTLVMFAVENQLFGKIKTDKQGKPVKDAEGYTLYEYPPFIGHLMNILLYMGACILLYLWLLQLFDADKKAFPNGVLIAFFTTLLFTFHPIHTEAVANIKGRDEILALLLSILTAILIFKAFDSQEKRIFYFLGASFSFLFALLAKENPATFLAVIPLALWIFRKNDELTNAQSIQKIATFCAPLLVVGVIWWFGIRAVVVGSLVSGAEVNELMNNPFLKWTGSSYIPFSFDEKLATILYTWLKYIQLLIFPHPLTSDYYPTQIAMQTFGNPSVLFSVLLHLGALGYAFWKLPQKSVYSFAIFYYFLTFSVVSNLVFPIGTNMGERFMFMPSVGFLLLIVYFLSEKWKDLNGQTGLIAISVICILFGFKTLSRNTAWYDNLTLFEADIQVSENSAKINNGLAGLITESTYDTTLHQTDADKIALANRAIPYFQKAVKLHPTFSSSWLLMGDAYFYKKEYDNALQCYHQVEKINPSQANLKALLGTTYILKGRELGEQKGDLQGAIKALEKGVEYLPNEGESLRLLGIAYGQMKDFQKALSYFQRYQAVNPKEAWAYLYLGNVYKDLGDMAKSQENYAKAYQMNPSLQQQNSGR